MFDSIGEKTLYVFAACNVISVPMVWAFYPESNQRTLEDMDLLFASDSWFVSDAEKTFGRLKAENPGYMQTMHQKNDLLDAEVGHGNVDVAKEENQATVEHADE